MLSRVTKNVFHFLSYLHVDSTKKKFPFYLVSAGRLYWRNYPTQLEKIHSSKETLNANYRFMSKFSLLTSFTLMSFKDVISDIILA
jgi:hypothetical protein